MATVKDVKRRAVHRTGKKFLQAIGDFQGRHSRVGTGPFLSKEEFPWTSQLEASWREIRSELEPLLEHPEDIPAFHQISPDQKRISKGDHWKTFAFYVFRQPIAENCALCPATARILSQLPGLQNAWFSILAPGYHIRPHHGPTRALLRCHLALRVPKDRKNCWIRVDDQIYRWAEGECVVFDDTYEHEVRNDTDEVRVVLFMDFDRPMDWIGSRFNSTVLRLMQASHYVKDPLHNLAKWNQQRDQLRKRPPHT